jgi:hypothetical protein
MNSGATRNTAAPASAANTDEGLTTRTPSRRDSNGYSRQ